MGDLAACGDMVPTVGVVVDGMEYQSLMCGGDTQEGFTEQVSCHR